MAASLSGDDYPLDVHQFAELVGKSADMVRHGVRHGRIQCHRHGKRYKWRPLKNPRNSFYAAGALEWRT